MTFPVSVVNGTIVNTQKPCVCVRNTYTLKLGKIVSSILILVPQIDQPTVTLMACICVSVCVSLSHSLSLCLTLGLSHTPLLLSFALTLHLAFLQLNKPIQQLILCLPPDESTVKLHI